MPITVMMQEPSEAASRSVGEKASPFPWLSGGASVTISVILAAPPGRGPVATGPWGTPRKARPAGGPSGPATAANDNPKPAEPRQEGAHPQGHPQPEQPPAEGRRRTAI